MANILKSVKIKMAEDDSLTLLTFLSLFKSLNFNVTHLERWKELLFSKWGKYSKESLFENRSKLLKIIQREALDLEIPFEKGWSSEKARTFLNPIVSEMGFYKEIEGGNWHAGSDYVKVKSETYLENNIAYYIEGSSERVNQLKIVGNMNSKLEEEEFFALFNKSASKLFEQAFNCLMPADLSQNLQDLKSFNVEFKKKRVFLVKNIWPTGMGYSLKFIIENLPLPSSQKLLPSPESVTI